MEEEALFSSPGILFLNIIPMWSGSSNNTGVLCNRLILKACLMVKF